MGNWNFADISEVVADELPDALCLIHGDDRRTWAEVDRRADGFAQHVLDAGLERQQAVAQYLYNGPEYIESMYGAFKGAFAGSLVTLTNRTFDPIELLDTIEREGVNSMSIVDDAFAKPIPRTLDANRGRWDLTSLVGIVSSGVLMDAFSSSEALGMGSSVSAAGAPAETAKFELSPDTIVIDDLNRPLQPGSGEGGRLAVDGRHPIGYYKDPEKTARTFPAIDGRRYSCPGDFATIDADGSRRR